MTIEEAINQVQGIFQEILDDELIELSYNTTADDVEFWDSLSHIQIIVAVEKHFNIRFNSSEIQRFENIGEMCESILSKC